MRPARPAGPSGAALGLLCAASVCAPVAAQQIPDPDFDATVASPAFPSGTGPRVLVDAAHQNFHTADGRYGAFAAVLRADGYRIGSGTRSLDAEALAGVDVLVIANPGMEGGASWALPTAPVFTEAEVATVRQWVEQGGALFLIADHMPAAGAAASLAAAFGVRFTNGYTFGPRDGSGIPGDRFTRADGTLRPHPITDGRHASERVDSIRTFTGQAFQLVAPADTLLRYGADAVTLLPVDAGAGTLDERTPRVPSPSWPHAVALEVGQGRAVLFGEAAAFSAQLAGPNRLPMGMNHPDAARNKQLLLNVLHWLSGLTG